MSDETKKAIQITDPDYDMVIKTLHLYDALKITYFWY